MTRTAGVRSRLVSRSTLFAIATLVAACSRAAVVPLQSPAPSDIRTVQERLGYPATARLLILHADDVGMSHSVNRASLEALEKGWITSASILVVSPWFAEAATWARAHPNADLGIHLALNSEWTTLRWGPISGRSEVPTLLAADGYLPLVTDSVERTNPREVERELRAQIDLARRSGVNVTHLDSHMGALFRAEAPFNVYLGLGQSYGLPVLLERTSVPGADPPPPWAERAASVALVDRVLQMLPGVSQEGWVDAYKRMLAPLGPGVYQLILHLGYDDDEMRGATFDHPAWGAAWRQWDFDLVRNPEFRDWLKQQGFQLITWRELAKAQ
ncbi:MAG TPA: polysaccharide deacetylase family protein [Gemmatimonadaceae bacterium]|nr:polysaccharide deacetylase family protein [Gemmatimonadaceae bacterium]